PTINREPSALPATCSAKPTCSLYHTPISKPAAPTSAGPRWNSCWRQQSHEQEETEVPEEQTQGKGSKEKINRLCILCFLCRLLFKLLLLRFLRFLLFKSASVP